MAKKFVATAGNYLTVTDSVTGIQEINHPTASLRYKNSNGTIRFYGSENDCLGQTVKGYPFGTGTGSVTLDSITPTAATGTVTLASAVANTFATGTVTCVSAIAASTVTVNGLTYTAVAGVKADNTEFSIDTSDTAAATDLADSITNDARTGTYGDVSATNSLGVVTITTDLIGTSGNSIVTLASSDGTTLAVSGATLSGGVDADIVYVNGLTYTAVAGAKADNTQFSIDTSDTAAATDLAASITNDVRVGLVGDTTAVGAIAVVTITSTALGTEGNNVKLASSSATRLAVSGNFLTGGLNDADITGITVNAVEIMSGTETCTGTLEEFAKAIALNINNFTSSPDYSASAHGTEITIYDRSGDTASNGFVVVSSGTNISTTDSNLAGAGADIIDSLDAVYANFAALITFLDANTGA